MGYAGGYTDHPTYREVCAGATGHAEVTLVAFDPSKIGYGQILDMFWEMHNPTLDLKDQYRSEIFYFSEEQRQKAEASKAALRTLRPVVTKISPAPQFWMAEEYHQRYIEKHHAAACGR